MNVRQVDLGSFMPRKVDLAAYAGTRFSMAASAVGAAPMKPCCDGCANGTGCAGGSSAPGGGCKGCASGEGCNGGKAAGGGGCSQGSNKRGESRQPAARSHMAVAPSSARAANVPARMAVKAPGWGVTAVQPQVLPQRVLPFSAAQVTPTRAKGPMRRPSPGVCNPCWANDATGTAHNYCTDSAYYCNNGCCERRPEEAPPGPSTYCTGNADCACGDFCWNGQCRPGSRHDSVCDPTSDRPNECGAFSCLSGLTCDAASSKCKTDCSNGQRCPPEHDCMAGICRRRCPGGCPDGQRCADGRCIAEYECWPACEPNEHCVAGVCLPLPKRCMPPCLPGSICVAGECTRVRGRDPFERMEKTCSCSKKIKKDDCKYRAHANDCFGPKCQNVGGLCTPDS